MCTRNWSATLCFSTSERVLRHVDHPLPLPPGLLDASLSKEMGSPLTGSRDVRRDEPAVYRICLWGLLDASWSDMLAGMSLATEEHEHHRIMTTLQGPLVDQAALLGVLNLVYNLGMTLHSVECKAGNAPVSVAVTP